MKNTVLIFLRFLGLGLVSFGGPAAHIGYFRKAFVEQLRWLDETAYGRLVAFAQFLPGPASSQVGFSIGYHRGGLPGAIAAFLGFTAPSFLLMWALAVLDSRIAFSPAFQGVVHGLKLLAVVVVTDAVLNMYGAFCKTSLTRGLCIAMAAAIWLVPNPFTQFVGLGIAGLAGAYFLKDPQKQTASKGKLRLLPFIIFAALLFLPPALEGRLHWLNLFDSFYQAGTFVFGGGHVVLPLLQNILGDSIDPERFLLGYAAAQAVPGPMFSLASFLGAELSPNQSLTGALIATTGIFLPGFLLVLAFQGAWERLASYPLIAKAAIGINASVVGLLVAALYDPVFLSAVKSPYEMALVIAGIFLLQQIKVPIFGLVAGFALLGYVLSEILPAGS